MGTSSTTYQKKWRMGNTKVVRVPEVMVEQLLEIARKWDGLAQYSLNPTIVKRLIELEAEVSGIRRMLRVSEPGAVLFFQELDIFSDRSLRVVADGFGGARILVTEGPYGFDEAVIEEAVFSDEKKACDAAEVYRKTGEIPDCATQL